MDSSEGEFVSDPEDELMHPEDNPLNVNVNYDRNRLPVVANPNIPERNRNEPAQMFVDEDDAESVVSDTSLDNNSVGEFISGSENEDNDDECEQNLNFEATFNIVGYEDPLIAVGNEGGNQHFLSRRESFILTIARTLRYKYSYEAMLAEFRSANFSFINAQFPTDMRQFWRIINSRQDHFTNIIVCTLCCKIIGRGKVPEIVCGCGQCGPGRANMEIGTYLYTNLHSQIKELLCRPGMNRDLQYPYTRQKRNNDAIEDVYDSTEYRRHCGEGQFLQQGNYNYSLAMWADSVSAGTTNAHIVPVIFHLLELSPRSRQRLAMVAALYVGPRKPKMAQFLHPVALELRKLRLDGVSWQPDGVRQITSRFMTLILSAGSEERCRILGMTRHNGDFGCTFCNVHAARIGHIPPIYRLQNEEDVQDRTDAEMRMNAVTIAGYRREGRKIASVNGVRNVSAMSIIPDFDLRVGQLVESMHCLWKGNAVSLFNNLRNNRTRNHITEADIATISAHMKEVRPPTKISRLPRDLMHFAKFTATEYRNLIWYYLLPCGQGILSEEHLHLCAIFAEATFILNKDSILPQELANAEALLNNYRQQFELLFPQEELTYNLHLLKHVSRCVRELGPMWVGSGFWFELFNRQIRNCLTRPTDRAWQVGCRVLLGQMVERYLDQPLRPQIAHELRELTGKERWEEAPAIAHGRNVRNNQDGLQSIFEADEIVALSEAEFVNINPQLEITRYTKTLIDGIKYQSQNNTVTKYNNSIAYVNTQYRGEDVHFVNIRSIVTWQHDGEERGIFGTRYHNIGPAFNTSYMQIVNATQELVYVPLKNIVTPAVLVQGRDRQTYISRMPNRWDND